MSISPLLADLVAARPLVAPSLLACDFGHLDREIAKLEEAGARLLHLDIMDGHFVPNLSIGVPIVEAVRRLTDLPLDVHLMISEPERYVRPFRKAGADLLTVHIEVASQPQQVLEDIRKLGAGAGLSLNPPTPAAAVEPWLNHCDLVLVMSVMPGFGGQRFDSVAVNKLRRLREVGPPGLLLSVDGGINEQTIGVCARAGADVFAVGTAFFSQKDYRRAMEDFARQALIHRGVQV